MSTTASAAPQAGVTGWIKKNAFFLSALLIAALLPFIIALLDGQPFASMLASETGQSKFIQGLMIEIFILGIYALSYDLVFGITGLLSFGHAMFFGVGFRAAPRV